MVPPSILNFYACNDKMVLQQRSQSIPDSSFLFIIENFTSVKSSFKLLSSQLNVELQVRLRSVDIFQLIFFLKAYISIISSKHNKKQSLMIQLYAIINDDEPLEVYTQNPRHKKKLTALLSRLLKQLKRTDSKLIKCTCMDNYWVYHFWQQAFLFVLVTQVSNRQERMQNYLRVVADIFYENYDERKFKFVLDRIMNQINKIEFGIKQQITMEDEQLLLVGSQVVNEKKRINQILLKKDQQSRRAYFISAVLFVAILLLALYYLAQKL